MFSLNLYICTTCVPGAIGSRKRALAALTLALQKVVSVFVDAGNRTVSFAKQETFLTVGSSFQSPDTCFNLNLVTKLLMKNIVPKLSTLSKIKLCPRHEKAET